ncbi:MAG: ABC transporter permease [Micrococcales bacterium]|jgi:peptide/nickel transport system permease protein|nr:ABC transporter permease [Micrococcales bacterium]MBT5398323.1 ABC transporter permease [Micrococcales bacterium]MBT5848408.1 ABC transporter permease [Micrococcales bacterium]
MMRVLQSAVVKKAAGSLATLVGVAIFVFFMLRAIPGDAISASLGTEAAGLTEVQRKSLEEYYGLDQSLASQFFSWVGNLFQGNLGFSVRAQQSVLDLTAAALPVTFQLAVFAIILALAIGVPVGMLAASRVGKPRDVIGQALSLIGLSVPAFLLATTLLTFLAVNLGFNPNGLGYKTFFEDPVVNLQQMLLPSLVLGFGISAPIIRTTRAAVLDVSGQDFVRTAKAKGVSTRRLQFKHILRNALIPIVTMTGLQFGYLLGGAVVVEQIFSLPGVGRQVLTGIQQKEYALVQSTVLVIAAAFVIVNLLTDLLYRAIDPRVRAE